MPLPPKMLTPPTTTAEIVCRLQVWRDHRVDRAEAGAPEHADQAAQEARQDEDQSDVPRAR